MGQTKGMRIGINVKYAIFFIIRLALVSWFMWYYVKTDNFQTTVETAPAFFGKNATIFTTIITFATAFCLTSTMIITHYIAKLPTLVSIVAGPVVFMLLIHLYSFAGRYSDLASKAATVITIISIILPLLLDVLLLFDKDGVVIGMESNNENTNLTTSGDNSSRTVFRLSEDELKDVMAGKRSFDGPFDSTKDEESKRKSRNAESNIGPDGYEYESLNVGQLKYYEKAGSVNPEKELANLVGMREAKKQIAILAGSAKFNKEHNISAGKQRNHMFLIGNPGTGKTTMARIITGILYKYGYIKENKFLKLMPDNFKGSHLGETGPRTRDILHFALGKVMFVDEAYSFVSQDVGSADRFGEEAIAVIMNELEDKKGEFVGIFAGYKDEMERMKRVNPGWQSRISWEITLENFSLDELLQIAEKYAKEKGYSIDEGYKALFFEYMDKKSKEPDFGNARDTVDLVDKSISTHGYNFSNGLLFEESEYTLCEQDFPDLYMKRL